MSASERHRGLRLCGGRRVVVSRSVLVLREESAAAATAIISKQRWDIATAATAQQWRGLVANARERARALPRDDDAAAAESAHRREPRLFGRALLGRAPRA